MGQKVHPHGFRLGIIKDWEAHWFNEKNYKAYLEEDVKIRDFIKSKYYAAGISKVTIERRSPNHVVVNIYTARPGMLIGKKGVEVQNTRAKLETILGKRVFLNIEEIKTPETDAQLVAESIAGRIEKRASYKIAMKRAIGNALKRGAQGVKIMVAGRLNGAEIARKEWYREGRVPLQVIRADIEYGTALAQTKYGTIGVKVWIYKGDAPLLKRVQLADAGSAEGR
ncbi:MAG: 30S ribosomal protein S3 [Thermotogae bacterium]|nr:30S ribosomal protein S3 [Thermotogota bacterium]RKX46741.1 MAG: 30S ribosomal protein S3 [Thermotogota bacterium]